MISEILNGGCVFTVVLGRFLHVVVKSQRFYLSKRPLRFYKSFPWFTIWTMFTKPSRIPGTFFYFWIRVNMKILAVTILTSTKFWKEITFRHFRHVIFMKKFAIVSFFTQTTKPMLTHYTIKRCWKVLPTLCTLAKFWKTPSERFPTSNHENWLENVCGLTSYVNRSEGVFKNCIKVFQPWTYCLSSWTCRNGQL